MKLSTAIPMVHRIMITFGGGSVKQNGVYDQVIKALKDRDYIEFWGIEPNPTIETLREAIQIAKGKQVDFLLAVGGGSVIDGTKLISAGIQYDGDPWELVQKGYYYHTVPMGTVLTGKRRKRNSRSTAISPCSRSWTRRRPSASPRIKCLAVSPIPSST